MAPRAGTSRELAPHRQGKDRCTAPRCSCRAPAFGGCELRGGVAVWQGGAATVWLAGWLTPPARLLVNTPLGPSLKHPDPVLSASPIRAARTGNAARQTCCRPLGSMHARLTTATTQPPRLCLRPPLQMGTDLLFTSAGGGLPSGGQGRVDQVHSTSVMYETSTGMMVLNLGASLTGGVVGWRLLAGGVGWGEDDRQRVHAGCVRDKLAKAHARTHAHVALPAAGAWAAEGKGWVVDWGQGGCRTAAEEPRHGHGHGTVCRHRGAGCRWAS